MTFFGVVVKEGKDFISTVNDDEIIHWTSACLNEEGSGSTTLYFVDKDVEYPICSLNKERCRDHPLNIVLQGGSDAHLKVKGDGSISITGYVESLPQEDFDDLSDDEDEEEEDEDSIEFGKKANKKGKKMKFDHHAENDDSDSEISEEFEEESEDNEDDSSVGIDDFDSDDEEDEDESDAEKSKNAGKQKMSLKEMKKEQKSKKNKDIKKENKGDLKKKEKSAEKGKETAKKEKNASCKCDACGKTFASEQGLMQHKQTKHGNPKGENKSSKGKKDKQ
ncbi:uncharacterized protein MONOS_14802 [Monocercomonoides exilis]|uniref:uncharacterized protein n=1 Tax=Monocercomonoides exilis TaxID=2049356 RepID=UPI003559BE33|nr:hypothetical protein MONOS_14802 [Monocercomonoides exilis]|eukprot:MONOS_14802.1-p1 / transcript=MONOS_14802.1 / gene=MONOS_14802 / organism=Monocercomonoides_exilis_PA203 / gene_product=unspecified product / transcript_product=unspecified product / location=Mono_scaffold01076:15552-16461(-) / protein_length=277 / sequence_SO=supercontig / SO=protein_coding / is_pseudo=false